MIINPKCDAIAAWRFSTWFVLLSPVMGIPLASLNETNSENKTPHRAKATRSQRTPKRTRRRHDPMLVFNMSLLNSAKVRECIFDSLPQRENVWL
jgi:hypothetical protein